MVDVVDSLLNNAVDLYVQAVDYRRIPTTIAGFRRYRARFRPIWPETHRSGRISSYLAEILAGSGLDLARTAESPASLTGILPEPQDPGQLAGIWPGRPASGQLAEIQ
jgi:hypothetical protein